VSRARASRAALALLFCALPAHAWKRTYTSGTPPMCLWWQARGHSFQIDAQGTPDAPTSETYGAIRNSFQTWAAVSCSDLSFPEEPLSTSPQDRLVGYFPGATNHNLVLWRTQACRAVVPANDPCLTQGGCSNKYDCWDGTLHGDGVIATTTTTARSLTGEILDTDIELNDAPSSTGSKFTFTTVNGLPCTTPTETGCVRIDVQNTVTHEAGHSLGLDHSPDPNATMYDSAPAGQTSKRILGTDDVAGICAIYPRGAATVTCLAPGSSGCGCSQAQNGPGAVLGALALLLQIRRRSRSRPQLPIKSSTNPAAATRFQSGSEN
jgi:MYXO-CTERM domain-containing protein